jgi:transposase
MEAIIAFDSHKRYTLASVETKNGKLIKQQRINHRPGGIKEFLADYPSGSRVAVETIGSWYWITDEIERAGMKPELVNARKARLMMGSINKTDKLDACGLNRFQRTGTLPTVWIAPAEIRDRRELPRTRMLLTVQRTRLKSRIHSVLDKYGLQYGLEDISDIFGVGGRKILAECIELLPTHTQWTTQLLLEQLDVVEEKTDAIERRMKEVFKETQDMQLLETMPGVGFILAVVIGLEIGTVDRFGSAEQMASYSGLTPRVHASGDEVRYGKMRTDANHYLKWAFSEAGNSIAVNRSRLPNRHVSVLYNRIRSRKGHAKAVGAVARHLAEASYWILSKKQGYCEPKYRQVLSTRA